MSWPTKPSVMTPPPTSVSHRHTLSELRSQNKTDVIIFWKISFDIQDIRLFYAVRLSGELPNLQSKPLLPVAATTQYPWRRLRIKVSWEWNPVGRHNAVIFKLLYLVRHLDSVYLVLTLVCSAVCFKFVWRTGSTQYVQQYEIRSTRPVYTCHSDFAIAEIA